MLNEGDYKFIIEDGNGPEEHVINISYEQDAESPTGMAMHIKPTGGTNLLTNEWVPPISPERLVEALNNFSD